MQMLTDGGWEGLRHLGDPQVTLLAHALNAWAQLRGDMIDPLGMAGWLADCLTDGCVLPVPGEVQR